MKRQDKRRSDIDLNRRGVVVICLVVLVFVVGLFHAAAYRRRLGELQGKKSFIGETEEPSPSPSP